MNKTLLQLAKEVPYKRRMELTLSRDLVELCVAWVNSEISTTQFTKVIGSKTPTTTAVASTLRKAVAIGLISIK